MQLYVKLNITLPRHTLLVHHGLDLCLMDSLTILATNAYTKFRNYWYRGNVAWASFYSKPVLVARVYETLLKNELKTIYPQYYHRYEILYIYYNQCWLLWTDLNFIENRFQKAVSRSRCWTANRGIPMHINNNLFGTLAIYKTWRLVCFLPHISGS